ncbi:copper-translocating P-type ATPase, putative [Coccidioides posadasii C735 delta SOWgp]|uniref:Cadmium resistance protein n=2 Tax=Coccidioides posadasii TaxID=199306 RepID=A0A0J6FEE4_COCPO|nr:copper-translocating P-type ATPase, putative [Coccidioides posadasii C735 delta SOWgp]EER30057.1 copper-translocating P-type ATPase, putative [Coccidioides posadasii C735 delta SOWgp]KMM71526.1 cadmium resistance protein [Coccidioides posadasii RMSCC 3488]|eukprot:XP_003072202.1 copper-translocating P-type ATPase, putative [Coccidioides posadasii C735 delta SOWgp]
MTCCSTNPSRDDHGGHNHGSVGAAACCSGGAQQTGNRSAGCGGAEKPSPAGEGDFDQCCKDASAERCDKSCIEGVAAYECQRACESEASNASSFEAGREHLMSEHVHQHDEEGKHTNLACTNHLHAAFERYNSYLESARCICRSVLMNQKEPCCARQPSKLSLFAKKGSRSAHDEKDKLISAEETRGLLTSDHGHGHGHGHDDGDCCGDSHGFGSSGNAIIAGDPVDIEKAAAHEHVLLSVSGMTCSGCGNKMAKTLRETLGVFNVRVNFVMGSADFDLDTTVIQVEELIRRVTRATGFQCSRLANSDQYIDVLMAKEAISEISANPPRGVVDVSPLGKKAARITYDPMVIGARSLVDSLGHFSKGLAPPNYQDPSATAERRRLNDMLIKTVVSAVFTIPVAVLAWGHTLVHDNAKAYVSLALATVVQAVAIPEFYIPAISSLIYSRTIEMDMLVVISITAAYVYSVVAFGFDIAGKPLETEEFFETSTLLITLVLFGRLVAAYARRRAVAAVSTRSLQPTTANLLEGKDHREIDVRLLQFGDSFLVMPHTKVPTDGKIVEGASEVDESMLTGESLPVHKSVGMPVIAGTINGSGILKCRLTRLPGKNTVTDIAGLVEEASNTKPRVQSLADRVAGWFVPIVSTVAAIVLIAWVVVCVKVRNAAGGDAVGTAITYAIAVFAVSCPCALGLAVPMVLVVAGGVAARGGVVIKSGDSTERAHSLTDVVFDKTGTITTGELDVLAVEVLSGERREILSMAKALVSDNKHPVSVSVAKYLENETADQRLENIRSVPGAGVEATLEHASLKAGNPRWLRVEQHPAVVNVVQQCMTPLCLTINGELVAVFGLKSNLRAEVRSVVEKLRDRNISMHIVSGDEHKAVEDVAASVGIPRQNVAARKTPAEKRDYVKSLMDRGKVVLFCGDGTNDAVAIAQADVGVQIGSSSDVTRATADVVLLSGLEGLIFLLDVSTASFRRIVFNFVWAAVYNVFAILLAGGAFVKVRIPPAYAGLGEIVSVLPVIIAALSMAGMKRSRFA